MTKANINSILWAINLNLWLIINNYIMSSTLTAMMDELHIKPIRKIHLIREAPIGKRRRITLLREPFPENDILVKEMPPKRPLPPIEERVTMVHVTTFEKKMRVLQVEDVETVRLVLFENGGQTYYREPTKNKLFIRNGPKSVGAYVGRWDPHAETIHTDIPDSDCE